MYTNMIQNWEKKGFIFKTEGTHDWSVSHAQVPFAHPLKNGNIRVFFATRDAQSCSSVSFVDVHAENPAHLVYVHDKAVLSKGKKGYFDDAGTMPSWFVPHEGKLYLYYTAWNKSETASYILSIGLAVSEDEGYTFTKMFEGPIMDRGKYDPIWVGQPCVLKEDGIWKMWYLSCQKIEYINDHPEPFYNVKYATSKNGIDWNRTEDVCIDFNSETDAIGRPCVWKENGIYKMLHSNRKAAAYRDDKTQSYRICYSESEDGIHWKERNDIFSFPKSNEGWDSLMNEYCSVYHHMGKTYMLYNGNGFGASGFGYAVLKTAAK